MVDLEAVRADHGMVQARHESATWQKHRHLYGVSFNQGHRRGFWAAVQWLLEKQLEWGSLTEVDAIEELRKGDGSVFYPIFRDDPKILIDCPNHGPVPVGIEGFCDSCGYQPK